MICPNCGDQLTPIGHASRPDTPPWLSPGCLRNWWDSEITAAGRWNHSDQAFDDADGTVTAAVLNEWNSARAQQGQPSVTALDGGAK